MTSQFEFVDSDNYVSKFSVVSYHDYRPPVTELKLQTYAECWPGNRLLVKLDTRCDITKIVEYCYGDFRNYVNHPKQININVDVVDPGICPVYFGLPENAAIPIIDVAVSQPTMPVGYEKAEMPSWATVEQRGGSTRKSLVVDLVAAFEEKAELTILHSREDWYPALYINEDKCRDYTIKIELYDDPTCYIEIVRTQNDLKINTPYENHIFDGPPTIYFSKRAVFITAEERLDPVTFAYCIRKPADTITKLRPVVADLSFYRFCRTIHFHIMEDVTLIKKIVTSTTTTTTTSTTATTTTTTTEEAEPETELTTTEETSDANLGWDIAGTMIIVLVLLAVIVTGIFLYRKQFHKPVKRVPLNLKIHESLDSIRTPMPQSTVTARGDSYSENLPGSTDPAQQPMSNYPPPTPSAQESADPKIVSKEKPKSKNTKIPSAEPPKSKKQTFMDPDKDVIIPSSLLSKDNPSTVDLFEKAEEKQPELLELEKKLKAKPKPVRREHKPRSKAEEAAKQTAWESHFEKEPWKDDEKTIDKAVIYQVDYVNQVLPIDCADAMKLADKDNQRTFCMIKHLFDGKGKRYLRFGTRFKCSFGEDGVPEYSIPPQLLKIFIHDVTPPAFEIHFRYKVPKFITELLDCPLCSITTTNTTITMSDYPLFRNSELGDFSGYIRNMPPGSHSIGFVSPTEDIREITKCLGIFVYRGRDASSAKKMKSALCIHKNVKELEPLDMSFVDGQLDNLVSAVVDTTNDPVGKNTADDTAFWEEQKRLGAKVQDKNKGQTTVPKSANQPSKNKDTGTSPANKSTKKSNVIKTAPTQED
uniref:Envelope glycoprotein D n=1 Tax=Panagrellus redivivus TaxID=6233 RepID=A0A7E4VU53_PANRE